MNMSATGRCIYPNLRWPPQKQHSAKTVFYYSLHTLNMQSMTHSIYLYQAMSFSIFTVLPSSSSHSLLTSPSFALSLHIINPFHCTGYIAFLKTLHIHFWLDVLPCRYDSHWLNNTCIFLGLETNLNPWRVTVFFMGGVSGVKNLNMCVLNFCIVAVLRYITWQVRVSVVPSDWE